MYLRLRLSLGVSLLAAQLIVQFFPLESGGQVASAVTEIKSPAGLGGEEPNLSVGPDGRIYMSWLEPVKPKGHALRFASRVAGGEWSPPQTVARGTNWFVSYADFPSVIALPDGSLAAHWLVNATDKDYLEAYHLNISFSRDRGKSWSRPVIPYKDRSESQHGLVSLIPMPDGRLGAIWLDGRNYSDVIEDVAMMYAPVGLNGRVGPDVELDARVCECCQTSAASTSDGVLLVYRDRTPAEIRDISIMQFQAGRWSAPRTVAADNWEIDGCPINGPAISAQGRDVVVAWFTGAEDKQRVHAAFSSDSGKTFSKPIAVDDGKPIGRVDALMLPSGEALVSWIEVNNGGQIRVRRVSPNGVKSAAVVVAQTSISTSSGFPKIKLNGSEVVVAWTQTGEPSRVRTAVVRVQ